jgi:hypothetical protein
LIGHLAHSRSRSTCSLALSPERNGDRGNERGNGDDDQ